MTTQIKKLWLKNTAGLQESRKNQVIEISLDCLFPTKGIILKQQTIPLKWLSDGESVHLLELLARAEEG